MDWGSAVVYNGTMQNKVYLDPEEIIVIEVIGDQDVASVDAMGAQVAALLTERRTAGKPCLVLDNLLRMGAVGPEARSRVVELAKEFDYDKAAMVGKGGLMRFGTNLMLRASGRAGRVHYFDDEQQARQWLHKNA